MVIGGANRASQEYLQASRQASFRLLFTPSAHIGGARDLLEIDEDLDTQTRALWLPTGAVGYVIDPLKYIGGIVALWE